MFLMRGITCIFLLLISTTSFCQSGSPALSKEYYLNKSRKQKTASYVLLGAGAASTISAFAYGLSGDGIFGERNKQAGLFVGIGLACVATAIPLQIASNRNERKAFTVSANFMNLNMPSIKKSGILDLAYPALCLKIDL